MPGKVSPTLEVLLEIRGELRELRGEIQRVDRTVNARIDGLENVVASEMSANREVLGTIVELLRDRRDTLGEKVQDHETRIQALERRSSTGR